MLPTETVLRRTPLYDLHLAAGAKMVPFGGWEMPLHYGSQLREHLATRQGAGIFDVSHMGQVEVTGRAALALVQEIATQDVSTLGEGESAYSVICREDGGLVDDLVVSRLGRDRFFLVVNAASYLQDVALMKEIAGRLVPPSAELTPCAEHWAMVAVQGPQWAEVCGAVLGEGAWRELPPFRITRIQWGGRELLLSTTGYTGERGAELLCPPATVPALWSALVAAGATPAGLAARDTLRLEKGYCLAGQDFTEHENPFEAGLGWVVKLNKESFSGRQALLRLKAAGVKKRLVGLLPEAKRIPRHETPVLAGGRKVGRVTSGGFAPSLGRPVALAYIAAEHAKVGEEVELALAGATVKATVTHRMFYPVK